MLLKAEKIISHDPYLMNMSERDMYGGVRHELAEKIVEEMINKDLLKIMVVNEMTDDFGRITKLRASVRAYNPDD